MNVNYTDCGNILQSIHISNHHVVYRKLMQCYVSYTSVKLLGGGEEMMYQSMKAAHVRIAGHKKSIRNFL